MSDTKPQIQESQRMPSKKMPNTKPKYIILLFSKYRKSKGREMGTICSIIWDPKLKRKKEHAPKKE